MKEFVQFSDPSYKEKVVPSLLLAKELGNSYCGSLYACLLSLIDSEAEKIQAGSSATTNSKHKRALMFSYGSGLAASLFSVQLKSSEGIQRMANSSGIRQRLQARKKVTPVEFVEALKRRELSSDDNVKKPFVPADPIDDLFPGTFYLASVDEKFRRVYQRTPVAAAAGI